MGAAVIALAECVPKTAPATPPAAAGAIARWLDRVEEHVKEPKPTLEDLPSAVWNCAMS